MKVDKAPSRRDLMEGQRFSAGTFVRVKPKKIILADLDDHKKKDGCLFMDQMGESCGRVFKISKAVHHFFNENKFKLYRVRSPLYILDSMICSGPADGFSHRCDRGCYLLWHQDWLETSDSSALKQDEKNVILSAPPPRVPTEEKSQKEPSLSCQLTNIQDVAQKNLWLNDFFQLRVKILRSTKRKIAFLKNRASRLWKSHNPAIFQRKYLADQFRAGDVVRVCSKKEIRSMLNDHDKYKGCFFIDEMYEHCEKEYRVLKIVENFYDEFKQKICKCRDTVILESVVCSGRQRLYFVNCDRNCFFFWHTAWLRKIK